MEVLETLRKEAGWHLCILETKKGIKLVVTDWNVTFNVLTDQKGKEFIVTMPNIRLPVRFKGWLKVSQEKIFYTYEKYKLEQWILSGSIHRKMYNIRLRQVQKRLKELK